MKLSDILSAQAAGFLGLGLATALGVPLDWKALVAMWAVGVGVAIVLRWRGY